jgi:hypothetical protein
MGWQPLLQFPFRSVATRGPKHDKIRVFVNPRVDRYCLGNKRSYPGLGSCSATEGNDKNLFAVRVLVDFFFVHVEPVLVGVLALPNCRELVADVIGICAHPFDRAVTQRSHAFAKSPR